MADPRFYDNRGPFALATMCAKAGIPQPASTDGNVPVYDVAGLRQAGPDHLTFFDGRSEADFLATRAGWCLVPESFLPTEIPQGLVLIPCHSPAAAFAAAARLFYPDYESDIVAQEHAVHPSARLAEGVVVAPGAAIGPGAEIGAGTRIGAGAVIGRGVCIGRNSVIGAQVMIGFAYLGDEALIQPGAKIGSSGFGFVSGPRGHIKIPQLGRVIIQDRVEFGANSTIDRGSLGDSVIGEGSKIDNLVLIGHNTVIGRHCIVAGQAGIAGSVVLGDFVVLGGMVGVADHVTIGDGARLAGLSGVTHSLDGGRDYGGIPARPVREWRREMIALKRLAAMRETGNKPDGGQ
jgi:UDP-3-O-[3-hydroxymyristoyl] glucosamine N-acyltransferase